MSKQSAFVRGRHKGLPLLLAAALACAGIAFAAPPASDPPNDAAIKSQVEAAFHADKNLLARHIKVSVKQGVVHLGGFVERQQDLQLAQSDARSVTGVKNVESSMTVKSGSGQSDMSGG